MLKVCDITAFYPFEGSGGVKQYILGKKAYIKDKTTYQHASIVAGRQDEFNESDPYDRIYKIRSPKVPWNPTYPILYNYNKIKRALLAFAPDIVEVGDPYFLPWIVKHIYRNDRNRPAIIGFYHSDFPRAEVYQRLKGVRPLARLAEKTCDLYVRKIYNALDSTIVHTHQLRQRLDTIGVHNTETLPYGVDTTTFRPNGSKRNINEPLKLLYVGRIALDKQIVPFLEKIKTINRRNRINLSLTIIGSGHLEQQLHTAARGIPNVRLYPFTNSREELARQYEAHDLLIVTNPFETFCRAALESMACGTPVAACSVNSGVQTFINKDTGFIVGEQLDDFIPFLESVDRKKLQAMRKQCRDHAAVHFDIKASYARYFQYYDRIQAARKPAKSNEHSQLKI